MPSPKRSSLQNEHQDGPNSATGGRDSSHLKAVRRLAVPYFVCPSCSSPLLRDGEDVECERCSRRFPCKEGLPELLRAVGEAVVPEFIAEPGVTSSDLAEQVAAARRAMVRVRVPHREHLERWLPASGVIAEIACGTAPIAGFFRSPARKFLALDLDRSMLREVKRAYEDVEVAVCDAFSLPLADASVDMVVGLGIFELDGARGTRAASESCRVLKKGGRLYISVPYQNVMRRGGKPARWRGHNVYPFTREDLGLLLRNQGFTVDEFRQTSLAYGLGPLRHLGVVFPALLAGEREASRSYRLFGPLLRPFANSLVCVATKN